MKRNPLDFPDKEKFVERRVSPANYGLGNGCRRTAVGRTNRWEFEHTERRKKGAKDKIGRRTGEKGEADELLRECKARITELCTAFGFAFPYATFDRIDAHLSRKESK